MWFISCVKQLCSAHMSRPHKLGKLDLSLCYDFLWSLKGEPSLVLRSLSSQDTSENNRAPTLSVGFLSSIFTHQIHLFIVTPSLSNFSAEENGRAGTAAPGHRAARWDRTQWTTQFKPTHGSAKWSLVLYFDEWPFYWQGVGQCFADLDIARDKTSSQHFFFCRNNIRNV